MYINLKLQLNIKTKLVYIPFCIKNIPNSYPQMIFICIHKGNLSKNKQVEYWGQSYFIKFTFYILIKIIKNKLFKIFMVVI